VKRGQRVEEVDPAVVRAAAGGDLASFEQLVRHHQPDVWRFLRRLLGDDALAEDVTQETFLRVYLRLDSFAYQASFSTWVFQIARNAGIDELRRRQRRPEPSWQAAPDGGNEPPARVAPADVFVEVQHALDSLPTTLRAALVLVEMLGFRYREAALVLGVPEGTVKSRVFHARLRLHRWAAAAVDDERGDAGAL
jgi:RNA polymerase sigma-70 factor, ECF subfamily